MDIPTSYGRPADAAAVSLDGESYQLVLAIRRNWVNDWTRPSRTYLITTMAAPQLIHTTPWFEDDAGVTTDDEDSAKVLSTRMVVTSRVFEPRSVRHFMTGSRRLARITRDQLFLSFEKAVARSPSVSHLGWSKSIDSCSALHRMILLSPFRMCQWGAARRRMPMSLTKVSFRVARKS